MQDDAILGQVVLGHSAMIDKARSVVATRLTVFPDRRDAKPDAAALLHRLMSVWPAPTVGEDLALTLRPLGDDAPSPTASPTRSTPLSLNIASEPWLRAMLTLTPPPHVMIEVPAFMVSDPVVAKALHTLRDNGSALVVKGRPASELPRDLLPCFRHSLIDVEEDRRAGGRPPPEGVVRSISHIQVGVRNRADVDLAFKRDAVAVLGWPLDDEPQGGTVLTGGPDVQTVMALMQRVDREEPIERLEAVLKNDPQLAFRLIRYLNSAAFGLTVEISSFQHALMLLGYKKLKRWLALLLASSSKDPSMKPAMQAAVRRGMVMEELVRSSSDAEMRSEMFICGVFSLLDRMLGQPFDKLFDSVPVPERVQQALVGNGGAFLPYLALTRALESGSKADIKDAADNCLLGLTEVNAALLRALTSAREFD